MKMAEMEYVVPASKTADRWISEFSICVPVCLSFLSIQNKC